MERLSNWEKELMLSLLDDSLGQWQAELAELPQAIQAMGKEELKARAQDCEIGKELSEEQQAINLASVNKLYIAGAQRIIRKLGF